MRRDSRLLVVDDEVRVAALPLETFGPPSSSAVSSSPIAAAITGGPERAIAASFVITTKCPIAACSAESPKLAPTTAIRRGTSGLPSGACDERA